MNNENMLSALSTMASIMADRWEISIDEAKYTQYAQAYAQIATAIAALSAPKPFVQIGKDIIRKNDILRIQILEENRSTYDNTVIDPKSITVWLREIDAAEDHGSRSCWRTYVYHSPEGQTLLEWLQGQSEILMPYEDSASRDLQREELAEKEDAMAIKTSQAESMPALIQGIEDSMPQEDAPDFPF